MDQGEGRLQRRVAQVGEIFIDLRRVQHALVDEGPCRQARQVYHLLLRNVRPNDGAFDQLANDVQLALEGERIVGLVQRQAAQLADEELADDRLAALRGGTDRFVIGRYR